MILNGIRRGDVYYVKTEYYVNGKKVTKYRPAVVISNDFNNVFSNYITIVYLTSKTKKPMPTHVNIMCKKPSVAMCEHIATISKEQIGYFIKTCERREIKQIEQALCCFLHIDTFEFTIHNIGFWIKRMFKKLRDEFKFED
ncbi:MAG: type II toxin-antitoxin system PemK/MazF family toxin [Clostridia bacterium]|nr:type II toxin-antitoxin system PemK/MazF family toxin [Clostridia bacterium]